MNIIVVGAGCQVKTIIRAAQLSGLRVCAIYDDDCSRWGEMIAGVPIVGCLALAPASHMPAVIGYDEPRQRKAIAQRMDLQWTNVVHPRAFLDQSANIGAGTIVLEGVVAQADVDIRQHVLVSANVTISHDGLVEDFCVLRPGVVLAGTVHLRPGVYLETGALVIPNIDVGAWSHLGPRAVVIQDVPENSHLEGLPAKAVAAG